MPKAISIDLRVRILECYDNGGISQEKVAGRFYVSVSFVKKLLALRRKTGGVETRYANCGRKPKIKTQYGEQIKALIAQNPGITLEEIRTKLGLECSLCALFHVVRALRLDYKKNAARQRTGQARHPGSTHSMAQAATRV